MAMKRRMPGGERKTITSLAVLARNDFRQADGRVVLPTPTASEHKYRLQGNTQQSKGLGALAARGELEMWPTPTARDWKDTGDLSKVPPNGLLPRVVWRRERERERHEWAVEPDVGRVADGIPARVDRLRALGNALVPQVAEWIGCRIQEWEEGTR